MKIEFIRAGHCARAATEAHIARVYRDSYAATVTHFAPLLATASNAAGRIVCAAGIRTARDGFFSDTYLDADLPQTLGRLQGHTVPAGEILEVVSLASTTPFPVLTMMDAIIAMGRARGMTWGVFTATRPLRRLLKRTGMPYMDICAAEPARIADPAIWGSYYKADPRVCAFSDSLPSPIVLSPRARRTRQILLARETAVPATTGRAAAS